MCDYLLMYVDIPLADGPHVMEISRGNVSRASVVITFRDPPQSFRILHSSATSTIPSCLLPAHSVQMHVRLLLLRWIRMRT